MLRYMWIVCALSVITSVVIFQNIPAGMELPVHWGADGAPDRYAPAWKMLFVPSILMVVMISVHSVLHWFEPRKENLQKSLPARDGFVLAIVLMTVVLQIGGIAVYLGFEVSNLRRVLLALGLAMMVMGNYMGKTRSNYFIGIQTPWTLSSEYVWRKTHRLAGKLSIFTGLVMLAGTWLIAEDDIKYTLAIGFGLSILIPIIYSWWLWRQEQLHETTESKID